MTETSTSIPKGRPASPSDITKIKTAQMPDEVFDAVNAMIARNYVNGRSTVKQEDLINEILRRMNTTRQSIFSNHWLDFESIYEAAGWIVQYDKPAYNESYEAYFTFEKR